MGIINRNLQQNEENKGKCVGLNSNSRIGSLWCNHPPGGLFASVSQIGIRYGLSPNPPNSNDSILEFAYSSNMAMKYRTAPESNFLMIGEIDEVFVEETEKKMKQKIGGLRLKFKVKNPSLRRLISGAIAGVVSRTSVAPLETVKTHLMVGSYGNSMNQVFQNIVENEGWKGLFRGNLVNVIRVAPSKGIELLVYDTVKKHLMPEFPLPASLVAGGIAGMSSTLCTYPLELIKTRLTVQRGVYKNFLDAFFKILQEGGPGELYRGLTPSIIGVVPYAATNYFVYDTLRKSYKKLFRKERVGNIETLLMGSTAGVISSSATFPLEVARKRMQLNGRQYRNMVDALVSIIEHGGISGLYRGLGASFMKLVPAAGISFMCYEACKILLAHEEEEDSNNNSTN
ncbi:adenine nucleotide transporter BT1, chloroplastic/mitochondrial-like [Impatiens glandulifera]|uniref:adenine nucleotide transporter BT1, chloroplastic/mitochondrial-like n=1 Tax=Impatiens glandulifera TaxID=253017 RepID=UPI001FB04FB6|nr:adenine nucleotide transporter BT1, chloroplastic/mitochondrial-like [Impatiens glandulifera]